MKITNTIILGVLLFTSSAAFAQGKSGTHGNKTVTVKSNSTNGSINANEHANSNAQINSNVWAAFLNINLGNH